MANLNIPDDVKYTDSDEWVRVEGNTITIGLTDYAQEALNDIVYVELPEEGDSFDAGESFGSVESVKAASDVYCPIDGEVIAGNEVLADAPETINHDAYGDGWIFKLKPEDEGAFDELMNSDDYAEIVAEDED